MIRNPYNLLSFPRLPWKGKRESTLNPNSGFPIKLRMTATPFVIILIAALLRLFPHSPNFAPIGAMALFGGAYLSKRYSIIMVFSAMFISDYLLLYINPFSPNWINFGKIYPLTSAFHQTMVFVYAAFAINILIGWFIAKHKSTFTVIGGTIAASIQFFLITNFAVWAMGAYSRGIDGLLQSYIMGLPFFKYTLAGDLFYASAFFGLWELALYLGTSYSLSFPRPSLSFPRKRESIKILDQVENDKV